MYVERPDDLLLPDNNDLEQEYSDQEQEEFINDTESQSSLSDSANPAVFTYLPQQKQIFVKMMQYLHRVQGIPIDIPRNITLDLNEYHFKLVPSEEQCSFCDDVDLSSAIQITRKGKIFTTTKVFEVLHYFLMIMKCIDINKL